MKGKNHGNAHHVCWWLAVAALACLSVVTAYARDAVSRSSEAQWLDQMANQATMRNSANGRGSGPNPAGYSASSNGAYASGSKALPWPGKAGANNLAAWKAKARGADLARALMNPGSAAITLLGGMALKQFLDYACVQVAGGVLTEGVAWDECKFVTQTVLKHKIANVSTSSGFYAQNTWRSTKSAACEAIRAFIAAGDGSVTYTATLDSTGQNSAIPGGSCTIRQGQFNTFVSSWSFISENQTDTVQDGFKPISDAAVEPKIAAAYEAKCQSDFTAGLGADSTCPRVFAEVVAAGVPVEVDDAEVDSPVYVEGPCVTSKTTHADGSYTNRTVCNDAEYDDIGNTVKRTEVKKETTQEFNADGTPKGPATTTTEETEDTRTECEKNPEGVACKNDTYDIPTAEIPRTTKTVEFSVEDLGWGAGSCPAPFTWTDKLGSHSLNLAQYCTILSTVVKPVLLALAAILAIGIAMPGMRVDE